MVDMGRLRDKKMRKQKVNEILNAFYLESIRNVKNNDLSIGQRRRVQVAREFMHEMDLLFLDEPTVGLILLPDDHFWIISNYMLNPA